MGSLQCWLSGHVLTCSALVEAALSCGSNCLIPIASLCWLCSGSTWGRGLAPLWDKQPLWGNRAGGGQRATPRLCLESSEEAGYGEILHKNIPKESQDWGERDPLQWTSPSKDFRLLRTHSNCSLFPLQKDWHCQTQMNIGRMHIGAQWRVIYLKVSLVYEFKIYIKWGFAYVVNLDL